MAEAISLLKSTSGNSCPVCLSARCSILIVCVNIVVCSLHSRFEKHFGRMADGAFCVTKAMKHELDQKWGIK